jgi:hypothetical protein
MRKWKLLAIVSLLAVLTSTSAWSQRKAMPGAPPHAGAPVAGTMKVTGPVKGAPTGTTFIIATPRKGPVTVDASGAKFRHNGKFASMSMLKGGAFVQATGTMSGTTLKATEVNIIRVPGGKTNKVATRMGAGGRMKGASSGGTKPGSIKP